MLSSVSHKHYNRSIRKNKQPADQPKTTMKLFGTHTIIFLGLLSSATNAFIPNSLNTSIKNKISSSLHANNEDEHNSLESNRRTFFQKATSATAASILGLYTQQPPSPAFASSEFQVGGKIRYGDESIMSQKAHGSTDQSVQESLRYGVSRKTADKICSFNRRFAEYATYFQETSFTKAIMAAEGPVTFYDSVTGKPLFEAPIGRSKEEFLEESRYHGWPSFRDEEVVWDNVRILRNSGETVSTDGTHLGHNIPDRTGNRYCINLVSVSGNPV